MTAGSVASPPPSSHPQHAAAQRADVVAVARGGLANLVGAIISAVANFLLVIVVARYLSPSLAGAFFGITSLFLILETVVRLGSDTGSVYFVARWRAIGLADRIRPGLRAALAPVFGFGVAVAIVLVILAPWLARLVGDGSASNISQLRLLAVLIPIAVTYDVMVAATRGFRRMRTSVVLEKIVRPLAQVGLVAVVLAAGRPGWLAGAWGLPYVAVAIAAAFALRSLCTNLPAAAGPARDVAREFWAFSLPRAIAGAAQIVLQRLDIVLVAALRGPREAAIYTAASRFLVLGQFLSQSIAAPVQPRLSAAMSAGDTNNARGLYRISTTWIVLVGWPTFLLAAVFAPEYLAVFGRHYTSHTAAVVVVLLAMSMLVATAVGVVDSVIIMSGRTFWNLATTLVAVAVNVLLDLLLIPHIGILGAATGWCAAILASNVIPLVVAWRGLGMHPFGSATVQAGALSVLGFAALPLLGRLVGDLPGAIVGAACGGVLYAAVVWKRREAFDLHGMRRRGRVVPA